MAAQFHGLRAEILLQFAAQLSVSQTFDASFVTLRNCLSNASA